MDGRDRHKRNGRRRPGQWRCALSVWCGDVRLLPVDIFRYRMLVHHLFPATGPHGATVYACYRRGYPMADAA